MENVWAVLKANVSKYKPASAKELVRVIKKEWKALDPTFAKKLSYFYAKWNIFYYF